MSSTIGMQLPKKYKENFVGKLENNRSYENKERFALW